MLLSLVEHFPRSADLSARVNHLRGPNSRSHFIDISKLVTKEEGSVLTRWCWWHFPGAQIQGSGLIKVGDGGVLAEKIAVCGNLVACLPSGFTELVHGGNGNLTTAGVS